MKSVTKAVISKAVTSTNPTCQTAGEKQADVVVYGLTSAGIIAAVQAKRMGKTVILVGPDKHLGGLTSGGLRATDIGNKGAIGGLSRAFYRRIGEHYGETEKQSSVKIGYFLDLSHKLNASMDGTFQRASSSVYFPANLREGTPFFSGYARR